LVDFLTEWLADGTLLKTGTFSTNLEDHLNMTDNEVNYAMRAAALDSKLPGHDAARRIFSHSHFRVLYERIPQDVRINSNPGHAVANAAMKQFGGGNVRYSGPKLKGVDVDFPVRMRNASIQPALSVSEVLAKLRPVAFDYVFIEPSLEKKAQDWLEVNRAGVLAAAAAQEEDHA